MTSTDTVDKMNDEGIITKDGDAEGDVKKYKYPRSVAFIVSNEFCERFMYYGMRTVLVLYLTMKLDYSDDTATIIYHLFTTLVYFMCIFGAIIADSWLGKFKTIVYLSIVYAIGGIVMSLGAMPPLNLPGIPMTMIGLALIALGSGGIKPCVAAFGGDQFTLPQQAKQLAMFFSLFYFAINSGSLISTTVTPMLRADVKCYGDNDCFSLAFGVPAILMIVSIAIFIGGKFMYINRPRSGNMVALVSKAIGNALATKWKADKNDKRDHWLDYAIPKYGENLVKEIRIVMKVLVLYIPLPVFWALFDQQGSRWTFQATRMNGELGGWEIKPDQMQVFNPLLILVFIPLYDVAFYPLLSKIGIRRPLQKLTMGGILAGIAFLCSTFVELELEKTYPILPVAGECQLRVYNGMQCDYNVVINNFEPLDRFDVQQLDVYTARYVKVDEAQSVSYTMTSTTPTECPTRTGLFNLQSKTAMSYFIRSDGVFEFVDDPDKSSKGDPIVRVLANTPDYDLSITGGYDGHSNSSSLTDRIELGSDEYNVYLNDVHVGAITLRQGGVYVLLLAPGTTANTFVHATYEISEPNSLHMLWLIPQYVIMTLGEVMYSVTGLAFSYSQAPESMKSVLQAGWLLTVAFGNLIVVIVAGAQSFDSQAWEFLLFAVVMFIDMFIFALIAWKYKYVEPKTEEEQRVLEDASDSDSGAVGAVGAVGKTNKSFDNNE